ncbi:CHAD domain-containing protein [Pseudomonas sp. GD03842]|uniref:CHAD domain-containing protein n=1 Tax=Pseudomonas sp. GD03842 TaxID=2975385 RepID=UPI00244B4F01|nr:CHAD domain-containing protein [Pseudomonas sp. GD03842]MDH0747197.1 CHAD domain-containing protein [Pseudomonas sp. GD03842]
MNTADRLVFRILSLQVRLYHDFVRVKESTDSEALHDLRIDVRRLRSVLRPLRASSEIASLDQAAAAVANLTTRARDLEVLIAELKRHGQARQAITRQAALHALYSRVKRSSVIPTLLTALDDCPEAVRAVENERGSHRMKIRIQRAVCKQLKRLEHAIETPGFDRHRLRSTLKRVRYLIEAFPSISPISREAVQAMAATQAALGKWHDLDLWCQLSFKEDDLQRLRHDWSQRTEAALDNAEVHLRSLAHRLPKTKVSRVAVRGLPAAHTADNPFEGVIDVETGLPV